MKDVSRRGFLGSSGLALTQSAEGAQSQIPSAGSASTAAYVKLARTQLPVLREADVVVVGGSFAGVACALRLARGGQRVLVVEPRTYLGREVTATLRPWIEATTSLPAIVLACTGRQNPPQFPTGNYVPKVEPEPPLPTSGEIPLKLDKVKLVLENLLLEAGVGLLYASCPVGVADESGEFAGLVVGNKSGRQVLRCRTVVDATETALIARLAGCQFQPGPEGPVTYRRTIEFDRAGDIEGDTLNVAPSLKITDNRVRIHRGYRGAGHLLLEFALTFTAPAFDPEGVMRREIDARFRTMDLASWLVQNVPAFRAGAMLAHTSYELLGPYTAALKPPSHISTRSLGTVQAEALGAVSPGAFSTDMQSLWVLSEAAPLPRSAANWFDGPVNATRAGEALAAALLNQSVAKSTVKVSAARPATGEALDLEVREQQSPQHGRRYRQQTIAPVTVSVADRVGVLVVGGGTSGATAAASAAREGAKTLLLEMNPGLGGTGTIGAVDSYWFGRQRTGFAKRVSAAVADVHRSIGYAPDKGTTERWNIEAKMFALLREAETSGAKVLFHSIVTGAIVEGNRVKGVVAATRYGPRAILADVTIDASGDGDVAAFAGAEFVYGSTMDHYGMWCAFAQFTTPGKNSNHFTGAVDVSNIEDYNRVILEGRRRGNNPHDHGVYVAPRESRHVLGDVLITLTDQFRQRRWPDVVNIHYSNHDIKGKTMSQWLQSGLMPPHLETEIPYRALLPRAFDNIIVAGKAFSTNHDGSAGIRMQADLENLGGIVGIAAANCARDKTAPRDLNVRDLQQRLIQEGLIPQTVLTRKLRPFRRTETELQDLVDRMLKDQPLQEYQNMEIFEVFRGQIPFVEVCTAGARIIPLLEAALESPRRVLAAQALAIYGSKAGVPVLIEAIERSLRAGKVPARTRHIQFTQLPPDHGAMPDVCYWLFSLGMMRDPRAIPVWQRVADILDPQPEQFRDMMRSPFQYLDAVCFGAERLGSPAAVGALTRLHAYPVFRNQLLTDRLEPDYLKERQAMCELSLGKALARCGSAQGLEVLVEYLQDKRTLLSEQAHAQLVSITGRDLGKDVVAWRMWLERVGAAHEPRPLTEDRDILYDEEILVD
ncbi:MAG TPA: FAD-dependent oxidoreductase [Bryobacteraceae bacterium]|nr:FAD-dependent oxidoreductase [Bryobacteraceae bacterium]